MKVPDGQFKAHWFIEVSNIYPVAQLEHDVGLVQAKHWDEQGTQRDPSGAVKVPAGQTHYPFTTLKPGLHEVQFVDTIEQVVQLVLHGWQYKLAENDTRIRPDLHVQVPSPLLIEPVAQLWHVVAFVHCWHPTPHGAHVPFAFWKYPGLHTQTPLTTILLSIQFKHCLLVKLTASIVQVWHLGSILLHEASTHT